MLLIRSRDLDDTLFGFTWIDLNDLYSKKRCSPWFSLHIGTKISSVGPIEAEIFNFFDLVNRIFSTTLKVTTSKEIHLNSFIGDSFQPRGSAFSCTSTVWKRGFRGKKGDFAVYQLWFRLERAELSWLEAIVLRGGGFMPWTDAVTPFRRTI